MADKTKQAKQPAQKGMTKREKLIQKICDGNKDEVNIEGYIYEVEMSEHEEEVILRPHGSGSEASSRTGWDDYGYTHGGDTYKEAVDLAHEINEEMRTRRAKESDI